MAATGGGSLYASLPKVWLAPKILNLAEYGRTTHRRPRWRPSAPVRRPPRFAASPAGVGRPPRRRPPYMDKAGWVPRRLRVCTRLASRLGWTRPSNEARAERGLEVVDPSVSRHEARASLRTPAISCRIGGEAG